jgi:ABC-type transport system involved in cytochrome bd biosynthesis fused ATPase/permease subunit
MSEVFQNKVAESGIITLDLEQYYPKGEVAVFDMKDYLFMGLILKEKDFREALKNIDWEIYRDKNVAVTCSADAIIPVWAYMLVSAGLQPVAANVVFGTQEEILQQLLLLNIAAIDTEQFTDKRVVIKGCGEIPISEAAYLQITKQLRPVAKSIMYGEPCSTVPIYKKK